MKILSLLAIIFSFSQCGSTKFDTNPPFKIDSASYTNWVGGQPGVRGVKVEIGISENATTTFESLFFNKKETKLEKVDINGKTFLIGHFNTSKNKDIILHVDSTKELKNEVPKKVKLPFELKENEAVISYKQGDKTKYYKIETVKNVKKDVIKK